MKPQRSVFMSDVQLEDVEPDPFARFGGEQVPERGAVPPPNAVPLTAVQSSPSAAFSNHRGLNAANHNISVAEFDYDNDNDDSAAMAAPPSFHRNPMTKRSASIFVAPSNGPAAGPSAAGGSRSAAAATAAGFDVALGKPPGTSAAVVRRQVMMINSDLATGHEKTLKNTLQGGTSSSKSLKASNMLGMGSTSASMAATSASTKSKGRDEGAPADTTGVVAKENLAAAEGEQQRRQVPRVSTLRGIPLPTKLWYRISRSLYQLGTLMAPAVAVAMCACTIGSGFWAVRKDTLDTNGFHTWYELTTFSTNGPCVCTSNYDVLCSNLRNVFQQVSQLSAILIGSEFLLLLVLLFELSMFGIFGGPDFMTRLTLVFQVLSFATATLSAIVFAMAYNASYCDLKSFKALGYQLGWAFYARIFEAIGFFVVIVVNGASASKRGAPCTQVLIVTILFAITAMTTTGYGWMTKSQYVAYGVTSSCDCTPGAVACATTRTDLGTILSSCRGITVFQTVAGVFTVFFSLLRAVDNLGATLKFAEIAAIVFVVVAAANVANVYRLNLTAGCRISGVEDTFVPSWSVFVVAGSAGVMMVFIVLNGLYMTRAFVKAIETYIIDNLGPDSPWASWVEAKRKLAQEQESMPAHVLGAMKMIKGVDPNKGDAMTEKRARSLSFMSTLQAQDDDTFYQTGPFASVGPRTFYQVFWWDELMSVAQISAEEVEENLNSVEEDRTEVVRLAAAASQEEESLREVGSMTSDPREPWATAVGKKPQRSDAAAADMIRHDITVTEM